MARYNKASRWLFGTKWARKPNFDSPAAQEALHELARCFARAAVDAMIAELDTQQLADCSVHGLGVSSRR